MPAISPQEPTGQSLRLALEKPVAPEQAFLGANFHDAPPKETCSRAEREREAPPHGNIGGSVSAPSVQLDGSQSTLGTAGSSWLRRELQAFDDKLSRTCAPQPHPQPMGAGADNAGAARSRGQPGGRAGGRAASKQASGPASEQAGMQASEQVSGRASEHADEHTGKQAGHATAGLAALLDTARAVDTSASTVLPSKCGSPAVSSGSFHRQVLPRIKSAGGDGATFASVDPPPPPLSSHRC